MEENIIADKLVKLGAKKDSAGFLNSPLPQINELKNTIEEIITMQGMKVWQERGDCFIGPTVWHEINEEKMG